MEQEQTVARITELEQEIMGLPAGSIAKKTISGKTYYYHRVPGGNKRREIFVPEEELSALREQIERRKALQKELRELRKVAPKAETAPSNYAFYTNLRTGKELRAFSASVRNYKCRQCFSQLYDYLHGPQTDKVFILYGLRRTGKTTMIRQALAKLSDAELEKTAFIQITPQDSLATVNQDLKELEKRGYRRVFLDEVTLMEDFIEGAALFSDVFVPCGMRIVLSGTDSLGFLFTEDQQLYDRCILLHTTFIPYREFESVLGVSGIDEYIRYGGTMSLGGVHYNEASTFASKKSADEYVDTAIARNIQHSLRCYQQEGHFRYLQDLYAQNELTSAINRVVEDMNHRFTLEVLTRDFRSNDLGLSAANLRRDREDPTDILDRVDIDQVTRRLREILEIKNTDERTVRLKEAHVAEIKEYLSLLDLIQESEVRYLPDVDRHTTKVLFSQPGLRYAQASALIESLLLDGTFSALSLTERNAVLERILAEIRGRMMEDILLLETQNTWPQKQVFQLQFPIGELDMVIFDPAAASCQTFEIKHSDQAVPEQARHLLDPDKCAQVEHRYGPITAKTVLYRGQTQTLNGILYRNVEEYLREL